jgi:hypothetical protein
MRARVRITLAGLVLGMALAGSVAWATIPNAAGVINGCYRTSLDDEKGQLRLVDDPSSCRSNETAIHWNREGAPGAAGLSGAQGPPGDKGDSGAAGANGSDGTDGAEGATGPTGPAGPAGPTGPKGEDAFAEAGPVAWARVTRSGGLVAGSGITSVVVYSPTGAVWAVCVDLAVAASQVVAIGEFDSSGEGSQVYAALLSVGAAGSPCPATHRDAQITMTNSAGGGGMTAIFYDLPGESD